MSYPSIQNNLQVNNRKYYVQVNHFTSDRLLQLPLKVIDEHEKLVDSAIASRYKASVKLTANIDTLVCEVSNWRLKLTKSERLPETYFLKIMAQLKRQEIDLLKLKALEPVQIWQDIAPFIMKKIELGRQRQEEKSRLELITESSSAASLPAKRGTA